MDTIQLLLIIVLAVSTLIVAVVGIQLVLILYEARKIISRTHLILKGFDAVGTGLQHGLGELTGFVNGFKTIMKIVDIYNNRKKNE